MSFVALKFSTQTAGIETIFTNHGLRKLTETKCAAAYLHQPVCGGERMITAIVWLVFAAIVFSQIIPIQLANKINFETGAAGVAMAFCFSAATLATIIVNR